MEVITEKPFDAVAESGVQGCLNAVTDPRRFFLYQRQFSSGLLADVTLNGNGSGGRTLAFCVERGPDTTGVCWCEPDEWASRHFGMLIMRMGLVINLNETREVLTRLVAAVIQAARDRLKPSLISVSVDATAFHVIDALHQCGFSQMDLKNTFLINRGAVRNIDRQRERTEAFEYGRHMTLVQELVNRVEFPSRFSRDPAFSGDDVRRMYQIWVEKLLSAPEDERAARVYLKNGQVISLVCMARLSELEDLTEKVVFGNTIAISIEQTRRYGSHCLVDATRDALSRADQAECTLSAQNQGAIRAVERAGYRFSGSMVALHLHCDAEVS